MSGLASFIFGFLGIFFLSPILVPLAFLLGIIGLINRQFVWSALGLVCGIIGFLTSPILLAMLGLAIIADNISHRQLQSTNTPQIQSFSPITVNQDDQLVEGAKLCTRYLPLNERKFGIPEHLLAAIASTESGRFHKALGLNLPWPWTVKVEGTGYFFDSKQEAIDAVRSFQARGFTSIDVGCMQVNLQHHPNAFATLEQAFDPVYNVAYAAQLLKQNFEQEGSWRKATADYDSSTALKGEEYAKIVYGVWSKIINKVSDARAGRPILDATPAH